jgi:hypothetical protein
VWIELRSSGGQLVGTRLLERGVSSCPAMAEAVAVVLATWEAELHPELLPSLEMGRLPDLSGPSHTAAPLVAIKPGSVPTLPTAEAQPRPSSDPKLTTLAGPPAATGKPALAGQGALAVAPPKAAAASGQPLAGSGTGAPGTGTATGSGTATTGSGTVTPGSGTATPGTRAGSAPGSGASPGRDKAAAGGGSSAGTTAPTPGRRVALAGAAGATRSTAAAKAGEAPTVRAQSSGRRGLLWDLSAGVLAPVAGGNQASYGASAEVGVARRQTGFGLRLGVLALPGQAQTLGAGQFTASQLGLTLGPRYRLSSSYVTAEIHAEAALGVLFASGAGYSVDHSYTDLRPGAGGGIRIFAHLRYFAPYVGVSAMEWLNDEQLRVINPVAQSSVARFELMGEAGLSFGRGW